jgi:tetratricopeptide (TPR) repeat protein
MKQSDFKRRLKEIERADKRGLSMCSIELATQLVADYPDHGRAWFELALATYPIARYSDALSALRRGLRLCPPGKRHVVYAQFGHLYRQKGEFRRAEVWYRKALAGDPEDATWHIFLGALLAVSGRLKEAEAAHREATRCSEGCIDEAFFNLGLVIRAQGRYKEAQACFQKALKLSPNDKEARLHLNDMEQVLILTKKKANPQGAADRRKPSSSKTNRTSAAAACRH